MRRLVIAAAALGLAACASHAPKPQVEYQAVRTEVAVSCVPAALDRPPSVTPPAELAALADGPDRYVRLAAAYLTLWARSLEAEPVIRHCREAADPPH